MPFMMNELNKILKKAITIKHFHNIHALDRELFKKCKPIKRYIKKNRVPDKIAMKLPAVVIGAMIDKKFKIDVTRPIERPIAKNLEIKLNTIGTIGRHNNINVVGKCAEVNSANSLLLKKSVALNKIKFTRAYRPRTSQEIATCQNCITVFN